MNKSVILLFSSLLVLLMVACSPANEPATDKSNTEIMGDEDTLQNSVYNTLADINHNLELVRQKQGLIQNENSEIKDPKETILQNISLINALLDENRIKIEQLQVQTSRSGKANKALQRLLDQARSSILLQSEQILKLKQDLALEEFKVADLNVMMDEMQVQNEQLLAEKESLLMANAQLEQDVNKVYVVYGTESELREKELLSPRNLGQKGLLSPHFNRNRSFFSEMDLRKLAEIPLEGKQVKLLTLHPEDSFVIEQTSKEYAKIKVTDPKAFWSISHYLVVLVKN